MAKEIPLTQGKVAIVDDEDYERLKGYSWQYNRKRGYAQRIAEKNGKRAAVYLHREIMQPPPGMQVDHINGDKLDNRRNNLRIVTNQQNQYNSKSRKGISKYKGVSWHKTAGKWRAYIGVDGKFKHLGLFTDEKEAALAYDRAARELFGEYAKTNFQKEMV